MSIAEELERLKRLHENGALSDEEFAEAKAEVLNSSSGPGAPPPSPGSASGHREEQVRQWAMMLHLSLLAGYVIVGAGFIAPILIWMLKKEEYPELDVHGKNAINWLISHLIYGVVCAVLVLFAIGIPLIIALGIVSIVFPIMAGLKAQKGEVWTYPITIQFLK